MNASFDVALVGRRPQGTGIGTVMSTLVEGLNGFVEFGIIDPLRTKIPQYKARIGIFTDVLENYTGDKSYRALDGSDVKGAYVFFDSDRFPDSWVEIINSYLDFVLVGSLFCKKVAEESGVIKPIFFLPLSVDIGRQRRPFQSISRPRSLVKFVSIGAFHPRKNHQKLIQAFGEEFGSSNEASLHIHSNLIFGNIYDELSQYIKDSNFKNITLSCDNKSNTDVAELLNNSDIFVTASKGEGFGLPLHNALALGKLSIGLDTSSYAEIVDINFMKVPVKIKQLAYYPEVNAEFYGYQYDCYVSDLKKILREGYSRIKERENRLSKRPLADSVYDQQIKVKYLVRSFFKPVALEKGESSEILIDKVVVSDQALYSKLNAVHFSEESSQREQVKAISIGHDGGFFSVFNTYFSLMIWNSRKNGIRYVLPDWSIKSIRSSHNLTKFTSFCYGREEDGNIWNKLFQSPFADIASYDLEPVELNRNAKVLPHSFNEANEPNLTYIHAAKLYSSIDFKYWRKWYNSYFRMHIKLQPHIQSKIDEFLEKNFRNAFIVCAHIRHPSHAMEQPDGKIPNVEKYLAVLNKCIEKGRVPENWKLFVATDQEKVIHSLREAIGDRLLHVSNIERTTLESDKKFEALGDDLRLKEGHQIQHLKASDSASWSSELAEQVIVDAYLLASGNLFLHAVSNVATVVSFINPDIEMVRVTGV